MIFAFLLLLQLAQINVEGCKPSRGPSWLKPSSYCSALCGGGTQIQKPQHGEPSCRALEKKRSCKTEKCGTSNSVDYKAVEKELLKVMVDSQSFWPADYGHYGPFFVRLAWHMAGSYRVTDGRGGADGARIRFEPELSWDDNANLGKARRLLWPVKQKFNNISWADLIVLTGNVAIESLGGKILGFCGGRTDDIDGSASDLLGPTADQKKELTCPGGWMHGSCPLKKLVGAVKDGLIYVNAEGPKGEPDPQLSARNIRDIFGRMSMNDSETVALIGAGHSVGKCHGACPKGGGKPSKENPISPWKGACGSGKGKDAFTSGFELPWTPNPVKWDNSYFKVLSENKWYKFKGPGGKYQWKLADDKAKQILSKPVQPGLEKPAVGMLTSDVALLHDSKYKELVKMFAKDNDALETAFSHAWYKLTTRDMGPHTRCIGPNVPPPQPWQYPLPPTDWKTVERLNLKAVRSQIDHLLETDREMKSKLARLAWRCMATFRASDYQGGCNGARIRFAPQKDWAANKGLGKVLNQLKPIKEQHKQLSWADLIVLAGTLALEHWTGSPSGHFGFCAGRTDAEDDDGASKFLQPRLTSNSSLVQLEDAIELMGLTHTQFAVLNAAGYALGDTGCFGIFCRRQKRVNEYILKNGYGYGGGREYGRKDNAVNDFFVTLLEEFWKPVGNGLYEAESSPGTFMLETDLLWRTGKLRVISERFAQSKRDYIEELRLAWSKFVNSDKFENSPGESCPELKPIAELRFSF